MKIEIDFHNITPMPLNQCYSNNFRTGGRFKSQKYTQYISYINMQIRNFKKDIDKINKAYDPDKHAVVCDYIFKKKTINKTDGRIGQTSGDTSNFVKPIEDILFKQFIFDDSQVIESNAKKRHSDNESISIKIKLVPLSYVYN